MGQFSGFKSATTAFLRDLEANNQKAWFDENRARYDADYLTPAKEFVAAVGPRLQNLHPALNAEPRVNGSIFRVNRDPRVSKDKTPYKHHIDLWFWEGERKGALSGLFFRLLPDRLILGAGCHGFMPEDLKGYRTAVAGAAGPALVELQDKLAEQGLPFRGEQMKSLPRGFLSDDDRIADLLRFKGLNVHLDVKHPNSLAAADFVDWCLDHFEKMLPLHIWLMLLRN